MRRNDAVFRAMLTILPAVEVPRITPGPASDPEVDSVIDPKLDPWRDAVLLRREALASGLDDRALRGLVRSGELRKFKYGAYSPAAVYDELDARQRHALHSRAALRTAKTELVLSHTSALVEHGAPEWGLDLSQVHATRRDRRAGRVEAGVHQHQCRLREEDVVIRNGVPCTTPTAAVLETAAQLTMEAALCHLNHLLHVGLTTPELLEERLDAMAHHPGTLGLGLLIRRADARVETVAESRAQHLMWQHHVPAPVPQYEVTDGRGVVLYRLDFAWPERRAWLEFDGLVKYRFPFRAGEDAGDVVLRERQREDDVRRITGWRVMRITWADLQRPVQTARRILAFLAEA